MIKVIIYVIAKIKGVWTIKLNDLLKLLSEKIVTEWVLFHCINDISISL